MIRATTIYTVYAVLISSWLIYSNYTGRILMNAFGVKSPGQYQSGFQHK